MYEKIIVYESGNERISYSNEDIITSLSIGGIKEIKIQHKTNDIITPVRIAVHSILALNEKGFSKMYNIGRYFNIDITEELVRQSLHDYSIFEANVSVDTGELKTQDMSYFMNKYNPIDIDSYDESILHEIIADRQEFEYFINELLVEQLFFYYELGSGLTYFITKKEYDELNNNSIPKIDNIKQIIEYIKENGELFTDDLFTSITDIFTILYSTDSHNDKNNTQGLEFYNINRFVGEGKSVVLNLNEKRLQRLYNIYKDKIVKGNKKVNNLSKAKPIKLSMYIPSISTHTGIPIRELMNCNLLQIHSYITVISSKYNMTFVNDILSNGNGSKELKSINWLTGGRNE